jgi:hypothetical protein
VRYCPNLDCPHRQRIGSPAEFLEHVVRCSDCATKLVVSEDDAIEGRQAVNRDPYRVPGEISREDDLRPPLYANDRAHGFTLVVAGLVLAGLLYVFSSRVAGAYVIAWGGP